jgi:tellurite resistance-related uncharacterized protein
MIIVRLKGGLGNQLFQYAAGRRLSIWHHCPLKVDIRGSGRDRPYSLGPFRTLQSFADAAEVRRIRRVFRERVLGPYDPNVMNIPPHVYLDGWWQSEEYFRGIESVIREEFAIDSELEGKNRDIAAEISAAPSVSLHVRRGDYVSNPHFNSKFGTCPVEYYDRAMRLLAEKVRHPLRAFVFSDEPDWAAKNLPIPFPATIVSHNNSENAYEDLRLMSMCTHHIIANSTFSWWGAWLSNSADKIVISPKKWFNVNYDTRDLIPITWFKI